uniref:dTMP kinase n=1 Tax=viral metagenome TaxID=1070528 RepID=A0A6C0JTU1_9ZZZZ
MTIYPPEGKLIVFEGIDKSGKTTQSIKLLNWLQSENKDTILYKFPNRSTETGKLINDYLTKKSYLPRESIHLLFSANRWEVQEDIIQAIKCGVNVIADRYLYSGIAYSMANGLDYQWCRGTEIGLPSPDLVLFIDTPVEITIERIGYGEEKYEEKEFQKRILQNYYFIRESNWNTFDGTSSVDSIKMKIRKVVSDILK